MCRMGCHRRPETAQPQSVVQHEHVTIIATPRVNHRTLNMPQTGNSAATCNRSGQEAQRPGTDSGGYDGRFRQRG